MKRLFFLLCLIPLLTTAQIQLHGRKLAFSDAACCTFNLASNATTSAGVYLSDSTLIRTLWSDQFYAAGQHPIYWDGKNDDGNAVATGAYIVKVLSHNITYTWEGVIGACNNSDSLSGPHVYHYFAPISDMVSVNISGTETMKFSIPFSEGEASQYGFAVAHPRTSLPYRPNQTGQGTLFTCANNQYIFNGGKDYEANNNFVFATDYAGTESIFTYGQVEHPTNGIDYNSTLDLNHSGPTGVERGIACTNKYLFVSRQDSVLVYRVYDGSGLRVQSLLMTGAKSITNEGQNSLWIAYATSVVKYTINSNGSLTSSILTISGLSRPAAMDADTARTTLWVFDGGTQQVVQKYNSSTGSNTATIGTAGGYATSPAITNTKFYIEDIRGILPTYVRHQSDGSIWIGDTGNKRNMHFSASGTYIDNITYIPASYYCTAVTGQTDHIFAGFLEYTIDYSQPIATRATLINNWQYNYPSTVDGNATIGDDQGMFSGIGIFNNGKRYGLGNTHTGQVFVFELKSTGFYAVVGSTSGVPMFSQMADDLSLNNTTGTPSVFIKYTQNGYATDGLGEPYPQWNTGSPVTLSSPNPGTEYPIPGSRLFTTSANGYQVMLDIDYTSTQKYSVAGYNASNGTYKWKALYGTPRTYMGDYPDKYSDRGNNVLAPWGDFKTMGHFIVFDYRGENWKQGQTAKFPVFYENGLQLTTVGIVWKQVAPGQFPAPQYATNILSLIPHYDSDNVYWTYNSENAHGMQSWRMSNTSSVAIQNIAFTLTSSPPLPPTPPGSDLLSGVPNNSTLTVANGWTRFPASDNADMTTITRTQQADSAKSPDIYVVVNSHARDSVSRSLPYNGSFPNWHVTGTLGLDGFFVGSEAPFEKAYISVTDNTGKEIIHIDFFQTARMQINATGTYYGPVGNRYPASPFEISKSGSNVFWSVNVFGVTYSGTVALTNPSANINAPSHINFVFNNAPFSSNGTIDITTLHYDAN